MRDYDFLITSVTETKNVINEVSRTVSFLARLLRYLAAAFFVERRGVVIWRGNLAEKRQDIDRSGSHPQQPP